MFLEGVAITAEGRLLSALEAFRLAEAQQTRLVTRHAMTVLTHQFLVHLQLRLGDSAGARATLAALSEDERAEGEARIAEAHLCLIGGDPLAAVDWLGAGPGRHESRPGGLHDDPGADRGCNGA